MVGELNKMKIVPLTIIIFLSYAFAQTDNGVKVDSPCEHPVIKKAQIEGLNSLKISEIPKFWFMAFRCKRHAKKSGEEVDLRSLFEEKKQQNYEKAHHISGLGTCCLVMTVFIVFYSYVGYMMGGD